MEASKYCRHCGQKMHRRRQPSGKMETWTRFHLRRFCDLQCFGASRVRVPVTKAEAHERARQIKKRNSCERCGGLDWLQVHHRDRNPFNNEIHNLEVLCASCHRSEHKAPPKQSICINCGISFVARWKRKTAKICSARCASEFGRISAQKRWAAEWASCGARAMQSSRKSPRPSSKNSSAQSTESKIREAKNV